MNVHQIDKLVVQMQDASILKEVTSASAPMGLKDSMPEQLDVAILMSAVELHVLEMKSVLMSWVHTNVFL